MQDHLCQLIYLVSYIVHMDYVCVYAYLCMYMSHLSQICTAAENTHMWNILTRLALSKAGFV